VKRTALLVVLLLIYAAFAFRGVVRGVLNRGAFDPLQPLGRTVEQRIAERRYAEALPVAMELQQAYPKEPLVAFWIAQVHHGLNHPSAEADAWERYMALSPAPAEACPSLPLAYVQMHRPEKALSSYERCAELAPDDVDVLIDVGKAYAEAGRRDRARAAFERAAILDPDHPLPPVYLAELEDRVQ
jgi:tetratricopeptide (TPR) repeat protein